MGFGAGRIGMKRLLFGALLIGLAYLVFIIPEDLWPLIGLIVLLIVTAAITFICIAGTFAPLDRLDQFLDKLEDEDKL